MTNVRIVSHFGYKRLLNALNVNVNVKVNLLLHQTQVVMDRVSGGDLASLDARQESLTFCGLQG